jgi:lipopolysaccharide biosynthesis glycosyltransferase
MSTIPHTVINVFIGWDSREPIAADVCAHSILKHSSVPVKIHYLKLDDLEREGILTREREQDASTEFTYSRFLVPYLMKYFGKAIFCDCDFLWTRDIKELYDQIENKSVYVVPHENYGYKPKTTTKMDGQQQTVYPKKNWSSMMAFNCGSKDCQRLSLDAVNQQPLSYLHRFEWINNEDNIGLLKPTWNWLSGYYQEEDWDTPGAIHYTDGGPWFNDSDVPPDMGIASWSEVQYGNLWLEYLEEYKQKQQLGDKMPRVETHSLTFGPEMKRLFNDIQTSLLDGYDLYNNGIDQIVKQIKHQRTKQGILGISDMSDLSQTLLDKGYKWDKVVEYLVQGTGGSLTDWNTVYSGKASSDNRPIAFRGITKRHIVDWCQENNRDFYFIDTGYYGNAKSKNWHRVTKNNLQYCGELRDVPADRYIKAHGYTKKFTPGGKILLCPPSDKAMSFYGEDLDTWMETTLAEIKKYTDREIVVRLKKSRKERVYEDTIQQALQDDVHCLVTYNSIAAIEALMEGKPAFVLGQNAASPLCLNDLSRLENPLYPSQDEVMYLLSNLAYHMFTQSELQNGEAWRLIQEWYSK